MTGMTKICTPQQGQQPGYCQLHRQCHPVLPLLGTATQFCLAPGHSRSGHGHPDLPASGQILQEALCTHCGNMRKAHPTVKFSSASGTELRDEDPFLLLWFDPIFLGREMPQWQYRCRWHHKALAGTNWVGTVRLSCSSLCLSFLFILLCCANSISITI